jgi:signal transduction histidine kinase
MKVVWWASCSGLCSKVIGGGRGVDVVAYSGGQVFEGMRERAALIGGTLTVSSRAGRGTTVRVTVPLEAVR